MPRRPNSSTEEILSLTIQLIADYDVSGVSVDMIAARAGVSKATIYRRWRSREELIQATIDSMRRPPQDPDTGSLRGDLTVLMGELVEFLNRPIGGRVFAAFLNAAVRNPDLAKLNREMTDDVRSVYAKALDRAIERGELAPDIDVRRTIDVLIAPFIYRLLVDNSTAQLDEVEPMIDMVLQAHRPD